jgi:hypothetical protein
MQQKPRKHYLEESHLEVFSTLFPTVASQSNCQNLNTKTISIKYVKLLLWFLMIPISMQNKDEYQLILRQMKIQLSNKKIYRMEKENCGIVSPFSRWNLFSVYLDGFY